MAKSTRFATTVSTRNLIGPSGFDGFYLDGRISGPRDSRMGETTLDREDRGFFFAIYTNTGNDIKQAAFKNKKHLDKIFEDMKLENKYNIDYEINELADCAVNISARPQLNPNQNSYFAGLIVKDGELAAITAGTACAYLYRNDILYPLTHDDFPISDVDLNGNKVPNIDLYCAGVAGTIRYSNIAQLQADDCFILTNRQVMDTIGHLGMLRLLEEAYDQQDAACKVYDIMAEQNPGVTAQFMIGFVESLNTLDKAALKSLTGRMDWTQKTLNGIGGLSALSQASQMQNTVPVHSEKTHNSIPQYQEYNTYQELNNMAPRAGVGQLSDKKPFEPVKNENFTQTLGQGQKEIPQKQEVRANVVNELPRPSQIQNYQNLPPHKEVEPLSSDTLVVQARNSQIPVVGVAEASSVLKHAPSHQDERILHAVEEAGMSLGQKIVISILSFLIVVLIAACGYFVWQNYFTDVTSETEQTETVEDANSSNSENADENNNQAGSDQTVDKNKKLKLPSDKEEEEARKKKEEEERKQKEEDEKRKKEEEERKKKEEEEQKNKDNNSSSSSTPNNPNNTGNNTANTQSQPQGQRTYVIKAGDTLWGIANNHKGSRDINEYMDAIVAMNPTNLSQGYNSNLLEGMELILP